MNEPRRFQEDEAVSPEMRRLIASASPPRALPPHVYGRALGESRRKARKRRIRRRVAGGAVVCFALALLVVGLLERSTELAPESTAARDTTKPSDDVEAPGRPPPAPAAPAPAATTPSSTSYLVPSPAGWLERGSNRWGAQGAFYVDASLGSTVVEPAPPPGHEGKGWLWRSRGDGKLCLKGTSAGVQDGDFKTRWGVVAGFEFCHTSRAEHDPDRIFSIEECPWGEFATLRGVRFDLEGPKIPSEMRVIFAELGSTENAFVAVYEAEPGRQEIVLNEARVSYQQPPRAVRRDRVRGVEWLVPSRMGAPARFDFCVKNIELF